MKIPLCILTVPAQFTDVKIFLLQIWYFWLKRFATGHNITIFHNICFSICSICDLDSLHKRVEETKCDMSHNFIEGTDNYSLLGNWKKNGI